jgi:hypothetical protein
MAGDAVLSERTDPGFLPSIYASFVECSLTPDGSYPGNKLDLRPSVYLPRIWLTTVNLGAFTPSGAPRKKFELSRCKAQQEREERCSSNKRARRA